nr:MAG TPA: hypothetical protein [Caudoviricetes sp.]
MAGPGGPAFLIEWISHADSLNFLCALSEILMQIL